MAIPENNLVPGAFAEFDKSGAGGDPAKPHRVLLVGGVPAASTGPLLTPTRIRSEGDAFGTWGPSILSGLAWAFFRANRRAPRVDAIAIAAPATAAAKGTITITGSATASGTLVVALNGQRLEVLVAQGDDAAAVHAAIVAAITNAVSRNPFLFPVGAAVSATPAVEVTSLQNGTVGNELSLAVEGAVAGLTIATVDFTGGLGAELVEDAIAALGGVQYDTIVVAADASKLSLWRAFMASQWDAMVQQEGMVFAGAAGTHGDLTTLAGPLNNEYLVLLGSGKSPTPPWIWAAQAAAGDVRDPDTARPRFGLALPDCVPPAEADIFTPTERQLLLEAGVSTFRVSVTGQVTVERLITTYVVDDTSGLADPVFRNLSTMRNLAYLRWDWNTLLERRYSGFNVADDGTRHDPSVKVATPSVIRGEAVAWFQRMERAGRVEDFERFHEELLVGRHAIDVERIDVLSPTDLINELVTFATRFAFRL